jgi:hypothetical protein
MDKASRAARTAPIRRRSSASTRVTTAADLVEAVAWTLRRGLRVGLWVPALGELLQVSTGRQVYTRASSPGSRRAISALTLQHPIPHDFYGKLTHQCGGSQGADTNHRVFWVRVHPGSPHLHINHWLIPSCAKFISNDISDVLYHPQRTRNAYVRQQSGRPTQRHLCGRRHLGAGDGHQ